jgi:hypothetical protein
MAHITLDEARPYLQAASYVTKTSDGPITRRGPAVVALAFGCGLHPIEIVGLQRRHWRPKGEDILDVDLGGMTIEGASIRTQHRRLPIPPHTRTLVDAYLDGMPEIGAEDPLIRTRDGRRATRRSLVAQSEIPNRRGDPTFTLPEFAAAFATSLTLPSDDDGVERLEPGLYEYLIGAKPRDGSRWTGTHPPPGALRRFLAKHVEMWKVDRSFWRPNLRLPTQNQDDPIKVVL